MNPTPRYSRARRKHEFSQSFFVADLTSLPAKSTRGGDTHTPQARIDIARREEQIVALRLRHIPFAAIARTVGVFWLPHALRARSPQKSCSATLLTLALATRAFATWQGCSSS